MVLKSLVERMYALMGEERQKFKEEVINNTQFKLYPVIAVNCGLACRNELQNNYKQKKRGYRIISF